MNNQTHDWFAAQALDTPEESRGLRRLWEKASAWRYPLLLVVLPTLIVAAYYYAVAADQYESEAHFLVSSDASSGGSSSGFGALFGIGGASSQNQAIAVPDYLSSHEAVNALSRKLDLVAMFRRPEADLLSRLRRSDPTPEELQRFFEKQVKVHHDTANGITELTVRAFRPADAYAIASQLLQLGEAQVNRMNLRRYRDAVSQAEAQMAEAQRRATEIQTRMTAYRQQGRDIDPQATGTSQLQLVGEIKGQLASAQATLASMRGTISSSSPQYIAVQRQIRSLQGVLAAQSSELTGGNRTIAGNLGGFESLRVQQDFAAKNYTAAAAGLVKAQQDATRQQLYIVQVVDPNMPVKALFPKRERIILITFLALCVAYGIGWMILAGVREHAA